MSDRHPKHRMRTLGRLAAGMVSVAILAGAGLWVSGHGRSMVSMMQHGQMHGAGMQHHGMDATGHNEVTMPGLRGLDASAEESAELAVMFRGFQTLSRTVETLPNGIRTVTTSSDPAVMEALVSHVYGMIGRVQDARDPQIFIQSPTLDIFFDRPDAIVTEMDLTDAGIVVVQTSGDPEVVAALHTHAAEVSDMAARGMDAVHEMMTRRAGN